MSASNKIPRHIFPLLVLNDMKSCDNSEEVSRLQLLPHLLKSHQYYNFVFSRFTVKLLCFKT